MEKSFVEFKKERDLGSILNATFAFIKQEFKPLFKSVIVYAGPFVLLAAIAAGYYQSNVMSSMFSFRNFNFAHNLENFLLYFSLLIGASVLSYTMLITTVYSYIKLYAEKGKDGFEFEDVGKMIAKNFLKVFGTNILIFLIIAIGMLFCFVPGIYLAVSLCLIYSALIFEDMSFANAFSRSFSLTHFQWWWTLLLIIVIYLIVGVASYILAVPQIILSFIYGLNSIKSGAETSGTVKDTMLIVTACITFINSLLGAIPFIAMALQYFSIVEKKESPALLQKIEKMGE